MFSGVRHKSIWSTSCAIAAICAVSEFSFLTPGFIWEKVWRLQTKSRWPHSLSSCRRLGPGLATFLGFVPVSLKNLLYLPPLIRLLRLTRLGSGKKDGLGLWHRKLCWGNWPDRDMWLSEVSRENMLWEKRTEGDKLVPLLSLSCRTDKSFKLTWIVWHFEKLTYWILYGVYDATKCSWAG